MIGYYPDTPFQSFNKDNSVSLIGYQSYIGKVIYVKTIPTIIGNTYIQLERFHKSLWMSGAAPDWFKDGIIVKLDYEIVKINGVEQNWVFSIIEL